MGATAELLGDITDAAIAMLDGLTAVATTVATTEVTTAASRSAAAAANGTRTQTGGGISLTVDFGNLLRPPLEKRTGEVPIS